MTILSNTPNVFIYIIHNILYQITNIGIGKYKTINPVYLIFVLLQIYL